MNEELAYRTIAYLIGCYKNNDETTINQEEIDAINFILNENQQLKEQLETSEKARKKQSDKINNILDYIDSHRFTEQFENVCNERNVRKNIFYILDIDKGEMKDE